MSDADDALYPDRPTRSLLAEMFVRESSVDGASISVVGLTGVHSVISAAGGIALELERMQYNLGEGPHWQALHTGRPTLIGDIADAPSDSWPTFAAEVASLEVSAMFSIPMMLGAAVVGVVDLSRRRSGHLETAELHHVMTLTRMVASTAVRHATTAARVHVTATAGRPSRWPPEMRREVHQATGMLVAQLDISATDAFAVLRAYSFAHDRSLEDVADDIVNRRVDLSTAG